MVTLNQLEQLQKSEEELAELERQAKTISQRRTPQRRLGSSVTRTQQRQVVAQRQKAQGVLVQIPKEQQKIKEVRGQILENRRQQEIRRNVIQQINRELAGKKGTVLDTPEERNLFKKIVGENKSLRQAIFGKKIAGYQTVKLESGEKISIPVLSTGSFAKEGLVLGGSGEKVKVGLGKTGGSVIFRDIIPNQTLQTMSIAPFISQEKQNRINALLNKEFLFKMDKEGKVTKQSLAQAGGEISGYFDSVGKVTQDYLTTVSMDGKILKEDVPELFGKGTKLGYQLGAFPVFATGLGITGVEKATNVNLTPIERLTGVLDVGATVSPLVLKGASKGIKYFTEPIIIKQAIPEVKLFSKDVSFSILQAGKKPYEITQFNIFAIKPPRFALVTTRGEQLSSFLRQPFKPISRDFARITHPKGKIVKIEDLKVSLSVSDLLVTRRGNIIGTLVKGKGIIPIKPFVRTIAGTQKRILSTRVSKIFGGIKGELNIAKGGLLKRLTPLERKSFKKIFPENFVKKGVRVETGSIVTQDLFKITKKGVKGIPEGRTIRRGELLGSTEVTGSIKLDRELRKGIKLEEIEKIFQKTAIQDVTFPTARGSIKPPVIKSDVERFTITLPPVNTDIGKFVKGVKRPPIDTKVLTTLVSARGQTALGVIKQLKTKPISTSKIIQKSGITKVEFPKINTQVVKPVSIFAGTGRYERTDSTQINTTNLFPNQNIRGVSIGNVGVKTETLARVKPVTITQPKILIKTQPREVIKLQPREIIKTAPREIIKLQQREQTKLNQRQLTRIVTRVIPRTTTIRTPTLRPPQAPKSPKIPPILPFSRERRKDEDFLLGYKTFVIRRGKKVFLKGVRGRGRALKLGSVRARRTLRATFGVEPTKIRVSQKPITFTPPKDIFRSFRIKRGKKVKLKDTFIQKRGKRLASFPERTEIKLAKRKI